MAPSLSPTGFWCNAPPKRVSSAPRSRGGGDTARPGCPHYPLNTLAAITCKEAGFRSLCDAWADTTTAPGRTVCYQATLHPRGVQRTPLRYLEFAVQALGSGSDRSRATACEIVAP